MAISARIVMMLDKEPRIEIITPIIGAIIGSAAANAERSEINAAIIAIKTVNIMVEVIIMITPKIEAMIPQIFALDEAFSASSVLPAFKLFFTFIE